MLTKRPKSATFLRCQNASRDPKFRNLALYLDTRITKIDTKISKFTMLGGPKRGQKNEPFGIAEKNGKKFNWQKIAKKSKNPKKIAKNRQKIVRNALRACFSGSRM